MKGRSEGACGAWKGGARGIGRRKGCFTLNTLHFSTFTRAPKIPVRVVGVEHGREEPEVGGALQRENVATMEKLRDDYGRTIVMSCRD